MPLSDAPSSEPPSLVQTREGSLLDAAQLIVDGLDRAQFEDASAFVRYVATRTLDLALTVLAGADVSRGAPTPEAARVVLKLAEFVRSATMDQIDDAYAQLLSCEPRIELATGKLRLAPRSSARRRLPAGLTTPQPIVDVLLDASLDEIIARALASSDPVGSLGALRVMDLACGGGRILVSVARRIAAAMVSAKSTELGRALTLAEVIAVRLEVVGNCVFGVDRDPAAVALSRLGLLAFVSEQDAESHTRVSPIDLRDTLATLRAAPDDLGRIQRGLLQKIRVADPLLDEAVDASVAPADGFDLLVCNPPNATSTVGRAAKDRRRATAMRDRFGDRFKGFVDAPSLYLLLGIEMTNATSGYVAMLQPTGIVTGANNAKLRAEVLGRTTLKWLWMTDQHVGDATTRTAAVALQRTSQLPVMSSTVTIGRGPVGRTVREPMIVKWSELVRSPTWSHLVIDTSSVPCPDLQSSGVIDDVANVSADFRDQYYGLIGSVVDHAKISDKVDINGEAAYPKLITSGLIDPHQLLWGQRTTTFNRQRFESPRVDLSTLKSNPRLLQWCESRLQPKILLATQTRILESVIDHDGVMVPSVPVISIHGDLKVLWRVIAVLHTPAISAWMAVRVLDDSTAQSALKVNATQTRALPLPVDTGLWDQAAEINKQLATTTDANQRAVLLLQSADIMHRAYGLDADQAAAVTSWWKSRSRLEDANS